MPYAYPAPPPLTPPMMPRETASLPQGEDWMYEFSWGGERVRAVKRDGGVRLIARDGRDLTNRFPRIAAAVAKLRARNAILDGEILRLDSFAEPAFRLLKQAVDEEAGATHALVAYDLLCDDGRDVRDYSLLCRRLLLAETVQSTPLILSPMLTGTAPDALASAARLGFPGVVAKRAGSPYRPNSLTNEWLKTSFAPPRPRARPPL